MIRRPSQDTTPATEIHADGVRYRDLNTLIREAVESGTKRVELRDIHGQRYIGANLRAGADIHIYGTPGNDRGAFVNGSRITVYGNAQDGCGNTMNGGGRSSSTATPVTSPAWPRAAARSSSARAQGTTPCPSSSSMATYACPSPAVWAAWTPSERWPRFCPPISSSGLRATATNSPRTNWRDNCSSSGGVNSLLFWYFHGGLKEVSGRSEDWDPYLRRDVDEYIQEAHRRGWQRLPPTQEPKALFASPGNTLRRVRGAHRLIDELLPRLDLVVSIELRVSSTALYADYVLPAASSYEKCDVTDWYTPLSPFAHITNAAVPPLGEAKPEWEIFALLARKIQERAKQRGILSFRGKDGKPKRLDDIYERMTFGGRLAESDHERVTETIVGQSTNLEKMDWPKFKRKGFARFTGLGSHPGNFGHATDMKPGDTITPHTWRTEKKIPWPTLTRRIQFYIDQPLYIELGEELPVYKEPPTAGGDYPLIMTGGHGRHSIHALLRDNPLMLELERGEPVIFMSTMDAREREIADGDVVKVYNDVGQFLVRVTVSPAVQPGQMIVYHAWENFQFRGGIDHRNVVASPINPVELAGDYFHVRPAPGILQPGQNDRESRVQVVKV